MRMRVSTFRMKALTYPDQSKQIIGTREWFRWSGSPDPSLTGIMGMTLHDTKNKKLQTRVTNSTHSNFMSFGYFPVHLNHAGLTVVTFIHSITVLWGVDIIREDGDGICCCSGQPLQCWTLGLWMAELSPGEPWPFMVGAVRTKAHYIYKQTLELVIEKNMSFERQDFDTFKFWCLAPTLNNYCEAYCDTTNNIAQFSQGRKCTILVSASKS